MGVVVCTSIIWKYARSVGATVMYRGIRTLRQDILEEKKLEFLNLITQIGTCSSLIPTAYLQANPALTPISSTLLRNRLKSGESIADLVPAGCAEFVTMAYRP